MDQYDRIPAALQTLTDDQLCRLARSLAYRASQDARNHHSALFVWRQTLRLLITGELAHREGQARPPAETARRLRLASRELSERELVGLISEYRLECADVERHAGRLTQRFAEAIVEELQRALGQARPASPAELVWEPAEEYDAGRMFGT